MLERETEQDMEGEFVSNSLVDGENFQPAGIAGDIRTEKKCSDVKRQVRRGRGEHGQIESCITPLDSFSVQGKDLLIESNVRRAK